MTASMSRSPSPTSRRHRCCCKAAVMGMLVLVLVPLVYVGAFAGRGVGKSNYYYDGLLSNNIANADILDPAAVRKKEPTVQ